MVVIAALPLIITDRALCAPAILKSALSEASIDSVALDLNVSINNKVDSSPNKNLLIKSFLEKVVDDAVVDEYTNLVIYCANEILKYSPKIIALSLFASDCEIFCSWLCAELRERTSAKIVVGGPAMPINNFGWANSMIKLNLIDKYFIGDAENSFVEYVCEEYNKINSAEYKNFYIPDYTDYNFQSYRETSIPLVDSRGCVQQCEFCDVIELWPKFTYKTAEDVFNEMLLQIKKYNIFHFDFRSSISNGNQKEFLKLLHLMSDYNQEKFRCEQISWEGSFIVRSTKNQQMWELIKKSNGSLFLGVESVVESVRNGFGKKFTNQDLDWHLDQIKHHEIDALLLLIAHYPTETKEDYEFTKQWFVDRKHFSKYIRAVQIARLAIINDTRLHRNIKEHQIEIIHVNQRDSWISKKTNITMEERDQYFDDLVELVKSLGFVVT